MSGIFDQVINYAPPSLLLGTVTYKGTWSAATNTPTLINPPDSTTNGFYYVVSAAGTQFSLVFNIGDWIISNGSAWEKVDNTDAVSSVFGRTGAVVGVSTDYSAVGITATAVGASSPSTGAFTTLSATTPLAVASGGTGVASSTGTTNVVLSGSPTITTPVIAQINDANGNATVRLTGITSATDYLEIKNGIGVGSPLHVVAEGTSANIGMHLQPKGTGLLTISDGADFNKGIRFRSVSSAASAITLIDAVSTAGRVITLPDATDTLVGKATTDTLTNKTISLTSNTLTATSAQLATAVTDETGSGSLVFATSPTLVTPNIGVATGTSLGLGISSPNRILEVQTIDGVGAAISAYRLGNTVGNLTGIEFAQQNSSSARTVYGQFRVEIGTNTASAETGIARINVKVAGTNTDVGTFTSTGLNSTAIGATTPSTGAFTTISSTTGANFATSSGNVGIATGSPNYLLTVKGTSSATTPIISVTDAVSATGKHLKFGLDTSTGSGFGWLQYTHEGTAHEKIKINPNGGSVELCSGTTVASSTGLAVTGTLSATGAISTAATGASAMVINSGGAATDTALKINRGGGTYWLVAHDSLGGLTFNRDGTDKAYFGRNGVDGLYVTGTLTCTGALSKGSGSFRIEHPLPSKSATHQLVHSFIEGPKCDLIYRGKIDLVDGKASVNIDADSTMTEGTFEALCATVQCFTSNESGWGAIRGKVVGNILTIEAQDAASTDNVSWMVIGERKDPHIMDTDWTDENGRPIVEPLKPAEPALESK